MTRCPAILQRKLAMVADSCSPSVPTTCSCRSICLEASSDCSLTRASSWRTSASSVLPQSVSWAIIRSCLSVSWAALS